MKGVTKSTEAVSIPGRSLGKGGNPSHTNQTHVRRYKFVDWETEASKKTN